MLLEAVVAAFVASQICYFVVSCGLVGLFARRPLNVVDERTLGRVLEESRTDSAAGPQQMRAAGDQHLAAKLTPTVDGQYLAAEPTPPVEDGPGPDCRLPATAQRRIHVLVPVSGSRGEALEETLASIARQSYPVGRISVSVISGSGEPAVAELTDAIEAGRASGLQVVPVETDGEARAADQTATERARSDYVESRTEAATVADAFATLSFADDDVVTVVNSGTRLPVDAFELAVAGLEEYDIVQAKRTAGNVDDGLLPLLESAGCAIRSDLLFANSNAGPYRLLEEGYFLTGSVLADLERWRRDDATGSMALDVAAFRRGYTLGVLNRYVRSRCPTSVDEWVHEKRRQVSEPYRRLRAPNWSAFDRLRFVTGTSLPHLLAITNVIGIPVGLVVVLATAIGWLSLSGPLITLVACNAVVWAYYSVRSARAARQAVALENRWARLRYSLLSNPFTQALYTTLWAVPLALAFRDAVSGDESSVSGTPTE
ncbi:glycosyltransferase family 2 protein [Natrinema zhouii]|uniref:Glycosyltransferase family 2 protein n=1 Tax=Natrinema zhouii TaxID=1710539 RepID=A0A7D6GKX6_9EURY|nr:glycosyltransferase family 2 protein [Natrinema zhouii]QLK26640.1 glycosyltransferase family 2 protein [Natrinema zhouii]